MPKVYRVELDEGQRQELEEAVRSHPKPYVRERASGILKVAAGQSLRQVAYHQLLRRHAPETVKGWCERYQSEGINGLVVRDGRGRKAVFFPSNAGSGASAG